jgi:hypothetical protein
MGDLRETIVFDTTSGISIQEQEEILAGINAMAVGSRFVPNAAVDKARKKDFIFPLLINLGALLLLVSGTLLLTFFNSGNEREVRESSSALGITERMLIREIRRETNQLVTEKENQISEIILRLSSANDEYTVLLNSVETLNEAQKERAASLLKIQEEYRNTLSFLEEEKTIILENARIKEAVLKAQSEEKAKALSLQIAQGRADLNAVVEELTRLGSERERINRAENQMGGFYASANNYIAQGRPNEALSAIESMKEFLAGPLFQGSGSLEARKRTHLEAVTALEEALGHLMGRDISAPGSKEPVQEEASGEYLAALNQQQTLNADQQNVINQRDGEIKALKDEIARREQQLTETNSNLNAIQAQYDDLQRRMEAAVRAFTGE